MLHLRRGGLLRRGQGLTPCVSTHVQQPLGALLRPLLRRQGHLVQAALCPSALLLYAGPG